MTSFQFVMLVIWFAIVSSTGLLTIAIGDLDEIHILPSEIYEHSRMNWPFCIITSFIFIALDPLAAVAKFIYWIAHIGRKE